MKVEFYSTIEGVKDAFPIKYAKECLPSWVGVAKQEYLANKKATNIYRCPGITEILTSGFIVHAWTDIEISTDRDGRPMACTPSIGLDDMLGGHVLQLGGQEMSKHVPKRPWSHKEILKINTPWHVVAPKGAKLMMLPISYGNDFLYESTAGILDPAISNEINIQGYINGTGIIKAGTPIAHLIPMTTESCELVVRDMTDRDHSWVKKKKYLDLFSFVLNRSKVKDAYNAQYNESKCPIHFWK